MKRAEHIYVLRQAIRELIEKIEREQATSGGPMNVKRSWLATEVVRRLPFVPYALIDAELDRAGYVPWKEPKS